MGAGRRLPAAGLRASDDVAPAQQHGNRFRLNRRGFGIFSFRNRLQKRLNQFHFVESHVFSFLVLLISILYHACNTCADREGSYVAAYPDKTGNHRQTVVSIQFSIRKPAAGFIFNIVF